MDVLNVLSLQCELDGLDGPVSHDLRRPEREAAAVEALTLLLEVVLPVGRRELQAGLAAEVGHRKLIEINVIYVNID